jgi:hypothetical protein
MDTKPNARVVNRTCTTTDDGVLSSLTPIMVLLSSGTAIDQTDRLLKFLCCHSLPPSQLDAHQLFVWVNQTKSLELSELSDSATRRTMVYYLPVVPQATVMFDAQHKALLLYEVFCFLVLTAFHFVRGSGSRGQYSKQCGACHETLLKIKKVYLLDGKIMTPPTPQERQRDATRCGSQIHLQCPPYAPSTPMSKGHESN